MKKIGVFTHFHSSKICWHFFHPEPPPFACVSFHTFIEWHEPKSRPRQASGVDFHIDLASHWNTANSYHCSHPWSKFCQHLGRIYIMSFTWTRCVRLATFECACVIFCADYIILFDIFWHLRLLHGLLFNSCSTGTKGLTSLVSIYQLWCFAAHLASEKSLSTQLVTLFFPFAGNLILIANTIGPIVTVEPSVVDWGNSQCLEPITRSVLVSNNSVIPASATWTGREVVKFFFCFGGFWNVENAVYWFGTPTPFTLGWYNMYSTFFVFGEPLLKFHLENGSW